MQLHYTDQPAFRQYVPSPIHGPHVTVLCKYLEAHCYIVSTRSEAGDPPGWPQVHPPGKTSLRRAMSPARCLYPGGAALADLEGKREAVSGRRKCSTEQKSRARMSPSSPCLEEEKPWKHSAVKSQEEFEDAAMSYQGHFFKSCLHCTPEQLTSVG